MMNENHPIFPANTPLIVLNERVSLRVFLIINSLKSCLPTF